MNPSFGDVVPADEYFSGLPWNRAYEYDSSSNSFVTLMPGTGAQVKIGKGYYLSLSDPGVLLPAPLAPATATAGATIIGNVVDLTIAPGWNFVSLPRRPIDTPINLVIGSGVPVDVVFGYDPNSQVGPWLTAIRDTDTGNMVGNLTTMEDGRGYWVHSTQPFTMSIDTEPFTSAPIYPLVNGFNMVGVSVVDPADLQDLDGDGQAAEVDTEVYLSGVDWFGAYTFDPFSGNWEGIKIGSPASAQRLKAGKGYWLYVASAGQMAPPGVTPPPTPTSTPSPPPAIGSTAYFLVDGSDSSAPINSSSGSSDGNVALLAGIAAGAFAVLAAGSGLFLWRRNRRNTT